jgi:hypothetical protein
MVGISSLESNPLTIGEWSGLAKCACCYKTVFAREPCNSMIRDTYIQHSVTKCGFNGFVLTADDIKQIIHTLIGS